MQIGEVFLGVIALASLVQVGFLVALALGGRRLMARLDAIQHQLDHDVRPSLENFARISRNVGEISDRAVLQARRIDASLTSVLARIEDAGDALRRAAARSSGPLADLTAFIKGLRRGLDVYQQLRGIDRVRRGSGSGSRPTDDDEHLFI
jgi:hypothetical protein